LGDTPPYPLESGRDYTSLSLPTLVVAREELVPLFRTLVAPVELGDLT
jgi:myo-inositol-1(or 4)-monophosphatase